jgi:hypothetical protein
MRRKLALIGTAVMALTAPALHAADRSAQTLHDTYCVMCHTTQVYTRADRLARDYATLRAEVDRWQKNVSLKWTQAEIDAVAGYLAQRYYKLPCPDSC